MDATTVGVDLAKNIFVACVADCAGRIVERREFNRTGFLTWLGTLPAGTVIGMEACGSAHHWGRQLAALGHQVLLIPPQKVRAFVTGNKDDASDARGIWLASSSGIPLRWALYPSYWRWRKVGAFRSKVEPRASGRSSHRSGRCAGRSGRSARRPAADTG